MLVDTIDRRNFLFTPRKCLLDEKRHVLKFYQMPEKSESQNWTAFITLFGCFNWLRMPKGLTGSPKTFQSLLYHVLVGLAWNITVRYLDDCIVLSETTKERIIRLQQVFQNFCEVNLRLKTKRCLFWKESVILRTCNRQKWTRSRWRKRQNSTNSSNNTKLNRC